MYFTDDGLGLLFSSKVFEINSREAFHYGFNQALSLHNSVFTIEHVIYGILFQNSERLNPDKELSYNPKQYLKNTNLYRNKSKSNNETIDLHGDVFLLINLCINCSKKLSMTLNSKLVLRLIMDAFALRKFSSLISLPPISIHLSNVSDDINILLVDEDSDYEITPFTDLQIPYTIDLTYLAYSGKLKPVIGRKEEQKRITEILSKVYKNNPVLIGEPGVGKTSIVHALALSIANNQTSNLCNYHILHLDITSTVAGAKYRGEFEERIKTTLDNILLQAHAGYNIIIYLDDIHELETAGNSEGAISFASILKPYLVNSNLKIIGTSSFNEYRKIESDKSFERFFDTITVKENTYEETLDILKHVRKNFEEHYKINIPQDALETAISLSQRYITDRCLPDKAIDLLDEACSVYIHSSENNKYSVFSNKYIFSTLSKKKGIPVNKLKASTDLINLESILNSKVIGQTAVINSIVNHIKINTAGLNDEHRPLASFMFIGPTGVGKTETAKALTEHLFGDSKKMIRLDMSEYSEEHSVSKLIGSPPGYIGYNDPGQLTEPVRRNPYSLILFDEFEKAHPKIYNILLQILDEGCLTDSKGVSVNFKNTIIILTSNVGVQELNKPYVGFLDKNENLQKNVLSEVKRTFSPEFLNRLDELIQFNSLTKEDIKQIALIYTNKLIKKASSTLNIELTVSNDVIDWITNIGYSIEYGARELRRTIDKYLKYPLSEFLINNNSTKISIELANGQIKVMAKQEELLLS